jgi:hypothetical protein
MLAGHQITAAVRLFLLPCCPAAAPAAAASANTAAAEAGPQTRLLLLLLLCCFLPTCCLHAPGRVLILGCHCSGQVTRAVIYYQQRISSCHLSMEGFVNEVTRPAEASVVTCMPAAANQACFANAAAGSLKQKVW